MGRQDQFSFQVLYNTAKPLHRQLKRIKREVQISIIGIMVVKLLFFRINLKHLNVNSMYAVLCFIIKKDDASFPVVGCSISVMSYFICYS